MTKVLRLPALEVRQGEKRRRAIRQHDLANKGIEIDVVAGKVPDIALARVAQRPIRQALPAPVERGHREAAGAQIAHGLEIFLDEFGAALEQAHGALAPRRRRKARKAQRDAVRSLQGSGHHVLGDRIGWD